MGIQTFQGHFMEIIAKNIINNKLCYFAKGRVNKDIMEKLPAKANTPTEKIYFGLMRILKGEEIYVIIEEDGAIQGRTREQHLLEIWGRTSREDKEEYWEVDDKMNSPIFEAIIEEFGDGRNGFGVDMEDSGKEISEAIKTFEQALAEQNRRLLERPKDEDREEWEA